MTQRQRPARTLRVVGIGASAGGLEALRQLVAELPRESGLAFVVLQHLAESQTGKLAKLLARVTELPVVDAATGVRMAANQIYVVPPYVAATVHRGALVLQRPRAGARPHLPIDGLLRSLAEVGEPNAIGVVLSGTGNDGTEGLRAIKLAGGVTIAQEPSTAQFDEMPRSAIAAGVVDHVLAPKQIAADIASLDSARERADTAAFGRIVTQLRELTGIDFASYKRSTIERRLARNTSRLQLDSLEAYAGYLAEHPADATLLYEDLLIHVTAFLRDSASLDDLVALALPELVAAKPAEAPLRVWVPGCSTGEEVYSLLILLLEACDARGDRRAVQMFGSDLSERAIATARAGRYSASVVAPLGDARVARWFARDGDRWRVRDELRERCVFVRHDLAVDPPFSRVDIVSCRNVLIYLGLALQKHVIPLFHYALEQPGFLLLGQPEALVGFDFLFTPVAPGAPLFRRKPAARSPALALALGAQIGRGAMWRRPGDVIRSSMDVQRDVDHILLARYAPPAVIVDASFDIVQFRGRTGGFLEPSPGQPQTNVLKMARDGLATPLRRLLQSAQRDGAVARQGDLRIRDGEGQRSINLEVLPLMRGGDAVPHYLVVFDEATTVAPTKRRAPRSAPSAAGELGALRAELSATKEYLSSVITQHVATSEELGILNEELQSTNEELHSSNEELQTAKEELQSTNEELETVNAGLERSNRDLHELTDDLVNILASVDVAIVIVDADRRVRRFTPRACSVLSLIDGDIGRPIDDLKPKLELGDLDGDLARVLGSKVAVEREVRGDGATCYRMQIRPYRTTDGPIAGAVLSFVDVTSLRSSIDEARVAREAERVATEASHREKDAFLNAVSHELRTPLSAILLWTNVLQQLELAGDAKRGIDTIDRSARAEAQLVEDLLDLALSRSNATALIVIPERFDAGPVIETAIDGLRHDARAKGVELDVAIDATARVLADPRRLQQIVWNLVGNALKFTPSGGRIALSFVMKGDRALLTVMDSGKGIREDFLPTVFEPFAKQDESLTRAESGLGIGLSLVRHLVERQHGTIDAASDGEGRGARFTVILPAAS